MKRKQGELRRKMVGRGKAEEERKVQETSKNRSRFIKSGSRKEKKASISRTASKFITYGGYIPELNMFLNDSYYFKVYLLKEPVEEELFSIGRKPSAIKQKQEKAGFPEWMVGHLGLTMYPGLKIQLIASKHKILIKTHLD